MAVISPLPEPDRGGILSNLTRAATDLFSGITRKIQGPFGQENPPSAVVPSPRPTVKPAVKHSVDDYSAAIQKGFSHWGDVPAAKYAKVFAEESSKYPIFQKYPFLLPAISILETSAGKNVTYKNNLLNWGIKPQKQGLFSPQSMEEVIQKAASGISGRTPYYKKFLETGNLSDLANVYAPESDNPGTGGEVYAKKLQEIMDIFEQALQRG